MRTTVLLGVVLGLAGLAKANSIRTVDSLNLGYTVMATAGTRSPRQDCSDAPFWWVDTNGGVAGSAYAGYGFDPMPNSSYPFEDSATGSLLLSDLFTLDDRQALDISVTVMTAHSSPVSDVGFAVLLQDSLRPGCYVRDPAGWVQPHRRLWADSRNRVRRKQPRGNKIRSSPGTSNTR